MHRCYRMVKSALFALYRYIVWRRCQRVNPEIRSIRFRECLLCKYISHKPHIFQFMRFRCIECGCYVNLKTWCIDEKCPMGRW